MIKNYQGSLLPVPMAHYRCDIYAELKSFRLNPDNRLTPEIKKLVRTFTFTTANRASRALKQNIDQFFDDFENRFTLRAYNAVNRYSAWSPELCSYKTWVTRALIFECKALCEKVGIEVIEWRRTESLDAPIALPSRHDKTPRVIDMVASKTRRDFYEPIDLRDVREQLHSDMHREIFDDVISGAHGWKHFGSWYSWGKHRWYEKIWPEFVSDVKSIIDDWVEGAR